MPSKIKKYITGEGSHQTGINRYIKEKKFELKKEMEKKKNKDELKIKRLEGCIQHANYSLKDEKKNGKSNNRDKKRKRKS